MKKLLIILLLLPIVGVAKVNIDSLWGVWNDNNQPDTSKCKAMFNIAWYGYLYTQPDSAFYFAQLEYDFAKNKGMKKEMVSALTTQGSSFFVKGDYAKAIDYYIKCVEIYEELGNSKNKAALLSNIGAIYYQQGNYAKAIDFYTRAMDIDEKFGDLKGAAGIINNIGLLYIEQNDYSSALKYFNKTVDYAKKTSSQQNLIDAYSNIGIIYNYQQDYDNALQYYNRALTIAKKVENKISIATLLNNIGGIYYHQNNNKEALKYFLESLKLRRELDNKDGISISLKNVGKIYLRRKEFSMAISYCKQSLSIAVKTGTSINIRDASETLYKCYKTAGNKNKALEMYELFIATRDSIQSEKNQKEVIRQEYKYEYEKEAAADSLQAVTDKKITDVEIATQKAQLKQEKTFRTVLYGGVVLLMLFGGFMYNRFRVTRKQKGIIEQQKKVVEKQKLSVEKQKEIVEEAHKEITDSINYAERIQRSFLATEELLNSNLKEYFVFFQPKDVVSGDFYWAGKLSNGNFAMVNADSTGHGVPGAIMSILNVSSIESAVKNKLTKPADIFNETRKTIIERLKKDGTPEGGKDGMDASIISFDFKNLKMSYCAAQNPIWVIRNGEVIRIKPEKMPVGKHDKDHVPFVGGSLDLQKGDQIYTLTDGFQDQFGGPKGKKFMVKKMREYILSISYLSLKEQHQKINKVFTNWKGNLEQVDDVCVIGVKI